MLMNDDDTLYMYSIWGYGNNNSSSSLANLYFSSSIKKQHGTATS